MAGKQQKKNDAKVILKNFLINFLISMIKCMHKYCLLKLNVRKNFMLNKNGFLI